MSKGFWRPKIILIFTLFLMLLNTNCALSSLSTTLSSYVVSDTATYTFVLAYSNSATRYRFKIVFPVCVNVKSASVSASSGLVTSNFTYGTTDSSISFNLTGGSLNGYTFTVSNVVNCYYTGSFNDFKISANEAA